AAICGITSGMTVATITNVAGVTAFAGGLKRSYGFSLAQLRFGTAVQMDNVNPVGLQPSKTTLDAFQDGIVRPVRRAFHAMRMAAFGEQEKIVAPVTDRLSDHFFAGVIALGR